MRITLTIETDDVDTESDMNTRVNELLKGESMRSAVMNLGQALITVAVSAAELEEH